MKATPTEIIAMLTTNKKNLNIFHNERRVVLLAVIKSDYNLRKAFKINDPKYLKYSGYVKKFYRYDVRTEDLKKVVEKIKKTWIKLK